MFRRKYSALKTTESQERKGKETRKEVLQAEWKRRFEEKGALASALRRDLPISKLSKHKGKESLLP